MRNLFLGSASRAASVAVIGVLVAACSAAATPTPPSATQAAPTQAVTTSEAPGASAASGAVVVATASTTAGTVLVGPTGMALYTHAGDSATSSSCTGGCLAAWPALVVPSGGTVSGGAGATGTFATFTRSDDGTSQVTYNGKPLYYFASDAAAGDVTGNGVAGFVVATP
jgi:predicted lipoprotein with Yx(FWY)xxD motif